MEPKQWLIGVLHDFASAIESKFVCKEAGKVLTTNDFTTSYKNKLNGIAAGANKTTVVDNLTSYSSTSALSASQGRVLKNKVDTLESDVTKALSQFIG